MVIIKQLLSLIVIIFNTEKKLLMNFQTFIIKRKKAVHFSSVHIFEKYLTTKYYDVILFQGPWDNARRLRLEEEKHCTI